MPRPGHWGPRGPHRKVQQRQTPMSMAVPLPTFYCRHYLFGGKAKVGYGFSALSESIEYKLIPFQKMCQEKKKPKRKNLTFGTVLDLIKGTPFLPAHSRWTSHTHKVTAGQLQVLQDNWRCMCVDVCLLCAGSKGVF